MLLSTENIIGYNVANGNPDDYIEIINSWVEEGKHRKVFYCANPHSLIIAKKDATFSTALKLGDLITPDGTGILFASKFLGGAIKYRITGSFIFRELSHLLNLHSTFKCNTRL